MTKLTDDEIYHRLICAWNGVDPEKTKQQLKPANESTKQGWLRVYKEALKMFQTQSRTGGWRMTQKPVGPAQEIEGVKFFPYRTRIMEREWRSKDGRLKVAAFGGKAGYWAQIDNEAIVSPADPLKWKCFRSLHNAMKAAVLTARQQDKTT